MADLSDEEVRELFYPGSNFNSAEVPPGAINQLQFAALSGTKCPRCLNGILKDSGDCNCCSFSYSRFLGPY